MASSSTPAAVREMQKDLEVQASALSKIQKGTRSPYSRGPPSLASASKPYLTSDFRCSSSSPADISKNHQVRKQYTIQVGENELVLKARTRPALPDFLELELLNDGANVYKLIGPVLVKQDLAEAKANVKKRIEYISAELKRMDRALKDLEDKQNIKKESSFTQERLVIVNLDKKVDMKRRQTLKESAAPLSTISRSIALTCEQIFWLWRTLPAIFKLQQRMQAVQAKA
ncbi:hypothetical protein C2845_PM11G19470 [Panicum miliaceum]|uniref:Prefoldin subunit 6 n=1 Tax=Panicum miliaceum TaxID=4540 RepID=A0A3L6RSR8_PANMI|nr:hypothetical protein C2845_PM11G19470 [Panicum miliaceum]